MTPGAHKADFYQQLFEDELTGNFVTKADGMITMANDQCVKMLGYDSSDELFALNVRSLYAFPNQRTETIQKIITEKKT